MEESCRVRLQEDEDEDEVHKDGAVGLGARILVAVAVPFSAGSVHVATCCNIRATP